MDFLYVSGPNGVVIFLLLTVMLGGAAAFATGRAIATAWLPAWRVVPAAALLAATTAFLHYALFEEAVIPLKAFADAASEWPLDKLEAIQMAAAGLRGWAFSALVLTLIAAAGYRICREGQMARLYGFSIERAGPFSWRQRSAGTKNP